MEICTCQKCKSFQFTNQDGQQIQGVLVSRSPRNRHWASASQTDGCGMHISTRISISEDSSNNNSQVSSDESDSSHSSSTHQTTASELTKATLSFMAWLHLSCEHSHQQSRLARQYLEQLIQSFQPSKIGIDVTKNLPVDIRTICKRLQLTPQLEKRICCPKCYCLYDSDLSAPSECRYKYFSQSSPCGESLFTQHFIRPLPQLKKDSQHFTKATNRLTLSKPHSTYITQDFLKWLTWFIPQVEDSID
ncbi:hypothetical protein O181_021356 [Austropuccinia psidii MF-1]|uniref:Uncharacterized protein n=1 Tax=Austropuccinia psidii MF-1 TaxID=1389203 RepID=A0A9Q3CFC1_9BASI|nr:hypothetical protein [Austropuccinia psidii MF-1]